MRRRGMWACALGLLLLPACKGHFTSPPERLEGEGQRPLCGELGTLLSVSPSARVLVGEGQLFRFGGGGGTGVYRWSLAESLSGGDIEEATGVYVAGAPDPNLAGSVPPEPTIDVVRLEDVSCRGEALVEVEVVDAPRIAPSHVTLRPGQSVAFQASGGSGSYTFELAANRSGATLDAASGAYVAGSRAGNDVVRVLDTTLGRAPDGTVFDPLIAEATIEVSTSAGLTLVPDQWIVPVGAEVTIPVEGGSGELTVGTGGAVRHVRGTTVRAQSVGRADVTFTDRFTGQSVVAHVRAVAPHEASRRHHGDRSEAHVVVSGSYDIDGDGASDAIVGVPEASDGWWGSGQVRIYRGDGHGGLTPEPARIIAGASRDQELGYAVAVADLDGDGLVDLLVGARRSDEIRTDVGAVYVYSGVEGELFSEAPTRAWYGQSSFDLFGQGIAVCDFNADGYLDVAVSALLGQETGGETDQGVVRVFLHRPGSELRFATGADVTIAGRILVRGMLTAARSLSFGQSIAAGDFDGDGACDLAASASGPSVEEYSSGVVALYRGRAAAADDLGGLEDAPSLLWARADGVDDNARFGLGLGMGDVDGDGRADLVASRYLHDGAAGGDTGAVYALYGRALSGEATALTDIASADWSIEGAAAGDRTGNGLAVVDVDGDGRAEILSGDSRAQLTDAMPVRPGIVRMWRGGALGAVPAREYEGPSDDARFGIGVGAIGDLDGDHTLELLAFAPYYDTSPSENDDRGALFLRSTLSAEHVELTLTHAKSGQQVGRSVAWIGDLDGDGQPELAVGASGSDALVAGDPASVRYGAGAVRVYEGSSAGAPTQELGGFTGHGEGDGFGHALAPAGDFDGDGLRDLAVLAQFEDLGALSSTVYAAGAGCETARANSGAVYVFRGQPDGTLRSEPSFVVFGPDANRFMDSVAGDVDVNGDGLDDLIVGGLRWNGDNRGGAMVVYGRPASDRIVAICTPDRTTNSTTDNDLRGVAVAGLGDLDRPADGCDEYAVSAPAADPGEQTNAGEVYVFFPACGASPERIVRLFGDTRFSSGGNALAGGTDGTGDGVPDLLIGMPRFRDARGEVGRVVLVSGAYIASRIPSGGTSGSGPFEDPLSSARLVADGTSPGERLGESVGWARADTQALAILGGPFGATAGRVDTGGVAVFDVRGSGFGAAPRLRMSGESLGESHLGAAVHGITLGESAFVAVGAPWSTSPSGEHTDDGASYVFTIP